MSMLLYDEKELGNYIDFVVAALPVMLDILILMVQPTEQSDGDSPCVL